jgi:hypothetical protein
LPLRRNAHSVTGCGLRTTICSSHFFRFHLSLARLLAPGAQSAIRQLENGTLIIVVVMLIGCAYELAGPNIFQLTPHQQLFGGALSLVLHLCGTDLPIMIILAIPLPRHARLFSPPVAFLAGAASYPFMHVFE